MAHALAGTYLIRADCPPGQSGQVTPCFEPSAAIDRAGRIVVATFNGPELGIVEPDGSVRTVPAPLATGVESLIQADGNARLWYSRLTGGGVALVYADDPEAWSEPLQYIHPDTGSMDRQWLAFGLAGNWMVYSVVTTGTTLWAVPFTTDGFGEPVRIAGIEERLAAGPPGPPVVDPAGRLFVPFTGNPNPSVGPPFSEGNSHSTVMVGILDGESVTIESVHTAGPNDGVNLFWPTMALDGGEPVVVWAQRSGGVHSAQRSTGWSAAVLEADGPARLPGTAWDDDGFAIVWYAPAGPGSLDLMAKADDRTMVVAKAVAGYGDEGSLELFRSDTTDFANAVWHGGQLVVPWYDVDKGVQVAVVDVSR